MYVGGGDFFDYIGATHCVGSVVVPGTVTWLATTFVKV